MLEMTEPAVGNLSPAQAVELALLVDLEARWENQRKTPTPNLETGSATLDLQGRQKAYEAFRLKLAAYNERHTPAHIPELLLNTPTRLGTWCRRMRDLYRQVESDPRANCPAHLLEKAYRCADRVAARLKQSPIARSPQPTTIAAVIRDLEGLADWCAELEGASLTASTERPR